MTCVGLENETSNLVALSILQHATHKSKKTFSLQEPGDALLLLPYCIKAEHFINSFV